MISVSTTASQLTWSKIKKAGWELQCEGTTVGSLQRTSFWKSEYQATTADGNWTFRRHCGFRSTTEILDSRGTQVAVFRQDWQGGGKVSFFDGQTFQIKSKGLWRPICTVSANSGPVFSIDVRAKTITSDRQLSNERITLLMVLTWHVIQQVSEDAATTAVIVAATS
jgi:hypothetical protein